MKNKFAAAAMACVWIAATALPMQVRAQSEASALSAVSALPLASVVVAGTAVASTAVAVPVALSAMGAVLVVKSVEATARGTLCVLERVSDGARVSVEIAGRGMANVTLSAETVVTVIGIGAGVVLSAAGEAIAFLPNALGRALLHNERLTN